MAAPPTTDHELVRQALDTLDIFPGFGGTAIGDALAAAVELGQQAVQAPAKPPRADDRLHDPDRGQDRQAPVSILFLSDGYQTRGTLQPLEGAARAKAAGSPSTPSRSGRRTGRSRAASARFARHDPGAARPGHAAGDRGDDRRQVLRGDERGGAQGRVLEARLELGRKPGHSEMTNEFLGAAALLLLAAGLLSALWSPRLP